MRVMVSRSTFSCDQRSENEDIRNRKRASRIVVFMKKLLGEKQNGDYIALSGERREGNCKVVSSREAITFFGCRSRGQSQTYFRNFLPMVWIRCRIPLCLCSLLRLNFSRGIAR